MAITAGRRSSAPTRLAGGALLFLTACGTAPTSAPAPALAINEPPAAPVAPPPVASAPLPPINDDPDRLLGLDARALTELLGTPVRVRRDGGAEIRQFGTNAHCQIDAFLYADDNTARVSHIVYRRGLEPLDPAAARACLRNLLSARATS